MADQRQLLLVLSHMRSYSTLLTHLLDAHEEIRGWRELHRSYESVADVDSVVRGQLIARTERFVCDNILHNTYSVSPEVLASDRVRVLISIRNAQPTLQSLLRWGGPKNRFREPGAAAEYYVDRVRELCELGEQLGGRFILLRSDRLVNHPDQTLSELSEALGLGVALRPEYTPDSDTGQPRYGDFSRFIGQGKIVANRKHKASPTVDQQDAQRCARIRGETLLALRELAEVVI